MSGPRAIGADEALSVLRAAAEEMGKESLFDLIARLEGLKARALARAITPDSPQEDRLLTVKEAARCLNCSEWHLYREADSYPFTVRKGSRVKFSYLGIQRWMRRQGGAR
ncbi:MAG: helix-turn-helix domain-containing protein [Acidobacteria bacterium]|nr:helix-turn-helix domain-containing protein [Acidobacteriota bacterium]